MSESQDFWYVDHEGQMNFVTLYPEEDGTYETDVFEYDGYEYGALNTIIDNRLPEKRQPPTEDLKDIYYKLAFQNGVSSFECPSCKKCVLTTDADDWNFCPECCENFSADEIESGEVYVDSNSPPQRKKIKFKIVPATH